jgi:hypothetical protein
MKFEEVIKQHGKHFVPPQTFALYYLTKHDNELANTLVYRLQICHVDSSKGQEYIDKTESHSNFHKWCTHDDLMNAKWEPKRND